MTKLPALTGKEIVSLLKKSGFTIERQRGSHVFLKYPDNVSLCTYGRNNWSGTFIKYFKRCRNDKGGFPENS